MECYNLADKIDFVKSELHDTVRRSQSWMGLDNIIGGRTDLIVETILANLEETSISFSSAMNSFSRCCAEQDPRNDNRSVLFCQIYALMFSQYEVLKETRDMDEVSRNILDASIPGLEHVVKSLIIEYLQSISEALPYQERQDEPPEMFRKCNEECELPRLTLW